MKNNNFDKLFNFPCKFPIKVIGKDTNDFEDIIFKLIKKHIPLIHKNQFKYKSSSNKKYISVTITILATSKNQLDNIYLELNNHPLVLYTL